MTPIDPTGVPTAERIRDLRLILAHAVGPSTAAPLRDALAALDHVAERLWYCWQEEEYGEVPALLAYIGREDTKP
jgi:hypothetical protein